MSSGDTIASGGRRLGAKGTGNEKKSQPRPYIPKRKPPVPSAYSEDDYDASGNLKVLKNVPMGDAYDERRTVTTAGNVSRDELHRPSAPATTPTSAAPAPAPVPAAVTPAQKLATTFGKGTFLSSTPFKHKMAKNKFDVQTPENMSNRDEHYIAVIRTIENRHPDEDRILQKYALQYVARREGTYNPIEDPPVTLSDIVPSTVVVIDKIFSRDDCAGGNKEVEKYIKKMAQRTDLDVIPVYMNKPFALPLSPTHTWQYKDHFINQIMGEFYESREESASEILDRVDADREGADPKPHKWHVYDGISPQGAFGPSTIIKSIDEDGEEQEEKPKSWADQCDEADAEADAEAQPSDEEELEESWTEVKGKKAKKQEKRGGVRRAAPRKRH